MVCGPKCFLLLSFGFIQCKEKKIKMQMGNFGSNCARFSNFANYFPNTPISAPTLLQSSSKFIRASIGLILRGSARLNHKITIWGKNRSKKDNFHFYSNFCPIILKIAGCLYHGIISVKMNFCEVSPNITPFLP